MRYLILILVLLPRFLWAQVSKSNLDQLIHKQEWQAAVEGYVQYLQTYPGDSSAWFNLGRAQLELGNYKESGKSLDEALANNYDEGLVFFTKAKILMIAEDPEGALELLDQAAEKGFSGYIHLKSDETFKPLAFDQDFQAILGRVEINAYPCLSKAEYRHFDFWLGSWDVYVGQKWVGANEITMAPGGCAIHENYTTSRNYAGQSINFYDPIDKKWHQHWVGTAGDVYNYLETKSAKGMLQFESPFMDAQGNVSISRLTFTANEDGTVRQLFESSTDDGSTWSIAFDGKYVKR